MASTQPRRVHTRGTNTPAADAYHAAQQHLNSIEVPKHTPGQTPEQRRLAWDVYERKLNMALHTVKLASRAAYTEHIEQGTLVTFKQRNGKWQVSLDGTVYRYLYDAANVDGERVTPESVKTMVGLSHRSTFKLLETAHKAASMAVKAEARRLGVRPASVQFDCVV